MKWAVALSLMLLLAIGAVVVAYLGPLHRSNHQPMPVRLEVGDALPREAGLPWQAAQRRSILVVTSATCGPCNSDRDFEDGLNSRAGDAGVPVWYLLPPASDQDSLAKAMTLGGLRVLRGRLNDLGLPLTPTFLAVDRKGVIVAIRTGSVPLLKRDSVVAELLYGTSKPQYSRVRQRDAQALCNVGPCGIIELTPASSVVVPGIKSRVIPVDELSIRALHEFDHNSRLFLDCKSAVSPFQCQTALLLLAQRWPPELLYALDLQRAERRPD